MALATDLMGLGLPPALAGKVAQGGTGPLTLATAGSSFATAARIKSGQTLVSCSDGDGTKAVALPVVGGDAGALLADEYIVNNAGSTSLIVYSSSGVTISASGGNTSQVLLQSHTSIAVFPISTTQWVGVKGS